MSERVRWCAGCAQYVPEWPHKFVGAAHLADVCPDCKANLELNREKLREDAEDFRQGVEHD